MASYLKTVALIANKGLLNCAQYDRTILLGMVRRSHIIHKENSEEKIVMADNGSTIVCWHPKPDFPYEHSLPLPVKSNDVVQVLKQRPEDLAYFNVERPQFQREYLMKVTATTKHRWFPRPGKKFAKKTKPDREFL